MDYNATHMRQTAHIPADLLVSPITIVGVGGIGSHVGYLLARSGFQNLTLIDFDSVEEHNIGGQVFTLHDVKKTKVEALQEMIKRDSPWCNVTTVCDKFTPDNLGTPEILISGLDSMAARRDLWELARERVGLRRYIEGRMSLDYLILYSIDPNSTRGKLYESTIYPDDTATPLPCNAQQTMATCYMMASLIVSNVIETLKGGETFWELNADIGRNLISGRL